MTTLEVVPLVEAIACHLRPAEPLQHLKELERATYYRGLASFFF
ncbi:MAG: hypothetical protein ACYTXE_33470 [Nostoc sp.]